MQSQRSIWYVACNFSFSDRASLLWEGCWAFDGYTERLVKAVVVWAFPDFLNEDSHRASLSKHFAHIV